MAVMVTVWKLSSVAVDSAAQSTAGTPTTQDGAIPTASDNPFEAFGDTQPAPKPSRAANPATATPPETPASAATSTEPPPLLSLDSISSQSSRTASKSRSKTLRSKPKDDFYSSDSDDAESEAASTTMGAAKRQFKVGRHTCISFA